MIQMPAGDTCFGTIQERSEAELLSWGTPEWQVAKPLLFDNRVCLDIGAHIGLTSIRYSTHFDKVHSFEPLLSSYLEANTSDLDNVYVYNTAVSDHCGEVEMWTNAFNSGCGLVDHADTRSLIDYRYDKDPSKTRHTNTHPIRIPATTIDSYQFVDVDFIKIDVEGYNVPILNGMIETLKNNNPVIQIENNPKNPQSDKQMEHFLRSLGFKCVKKLKTRPQDWFFKRV